MGVPLWVTWTCYAVYWLYHLPVPGYAIGALATVAGIMSVREIRTLGKICWVLLLILLLNVEFKAIDKDRAQNHEQQIKFFDAQKEGFSNIAGGLQETIRDLKQTLLQTSPRALFGKPYVDWGHVEIGPGTQFHYNVTMTNVGNDVAQHVDFFSQIYFGKPDDAGTQRKLGTRFNKDWQSHKTVMPSDIPPGSMRLRPSIHRRSRKKTLTPCRRQP